MSNANILSVDVEDYFHVEAFADRLEHQLQKELFKLQFMHSADTVTRDDQQRFAVYAVHRILKTEGMSEKAFLAAANDTNYGWTAEKNARRVQLIKSKPLSDADSKELVSLTEQLRYAQEELHDQMDAELDQIMASNMIAETATETI